MKIAFGKSAEEVYLFSDEQGRDDLIANLRRLEFPKDGKSHEHFHLFSEAWGGYDLVKLNSAALDNFQLEPVHHLKVFMRPSEGDVWEE